MPTKKQKPETMTARLQRGAASGLWYGVPLALFAMVSAIVDYERARAKIGTSPIAIAAFYLGTSLLIGALTSLLEKQLRLRAAALLFGFVVMLPTAAGAMLLIKGIGFTTSHDGILSIVTIAALIGPMCANIIRAK